MAEKQENRTERASVMVTPEEKRAIQLVAAFDNATESDTLRPVVDGIVARAEKIRSQAAA